MERFLGAVLSLVLFVTGCGSGAPGRPAAASTTQAAQAQPPASVPKLFDIPRLAGVAIDGKAQDWGDGGFRINLLAGAVNGFNAADNLDARIRLAWDDRGLLVLAVVKDQVPVEAQSEADLWQNDCIEFYIADRQAGANMIQIVLAPGMDPKHPSLRYHIYDSRKDPQIKQVPATITAARQPTSDGYVMEVLLPWTNLGVEPKVGREVGLQVDMNDADSLYRSSLALWYPVGGTYKDSTLMHRLRLAERPSDSAAATPVAQGRYEQARRVVIEACGTSDCAGKAVTVAEGNKVLARGELKPMGSCASASMRLPMPGQGQRYGALTVQVEGCPPAKVELDDPLNLRLQAMMEQRPAFKSHVFTGAGLPPCEFDSPLTVESLIGPFDIEKVVYYDAQYNVVTKAAKPGRYGAVVTIKAEDGRRFTRYTTLFCAPQDWTHWNAEWDGGLQLPAAAGVDPGVAGRQHKVIANAAKFAFDYQAQHTQDAAVLLAGLYEAKAGQSEMDCCTNPQATDRQWWLGLKRKLNGNDQRFKQPLERPIALEAGAAAPVLREGTAEQAGMTSDAVAKIDAVLAEWADKTDEPFIACIARNGVVFLHKAYGKKADGKPMTTSDATYMASLTKLLNGTLTMMFVDQGLASLDDPIDKFLPELAGIKVERPVTIRSLCTHTAGMWDHWGDDVNDMEQLVAEFYPRLSVGKKFKYNGMDLAVNSKVMEQLTGQALPMLYREHLFGPLGMNSTQATTSSYDAASIAMDMAKVGQMLLNRGAYGDKRYFSPQTFQTMLPKPLDKKLANVGEPMWGIGMVYYADEPLSYNTVGHGSASGAILRVDLDNNLVVSQTRGRVAADYTQWRDKLLKTVAECTVGFKRGQPPK